MKVVGSISLLSAKSTWKLKSTAIVLLNIIPNVFFFGPASARSYKIGVADNNWIVGWLVGWLVDRLVHWLVGWLVGNAVFSETAQTIFLIFCMKLGDYKGKKVTEPDFWKTSWFRDIREKVSKLAQNQTLIFFSKTALTIFLVFGLKLVLNMTFNLNETFFSENFAIWRYLTSNWSKN